MIIYMHLVTYEMLVYIGYKSIMSNSLSIRSILDANKLTRPNFIDWFWNIKIVLKQEKKAYVLDDLIPREPNEKAFNEEREAYWVHMEDLDLATYVMLASMAPDLQKQHKAIMLRILS